MQNPISLEKKTLEVYDAEINSLCLTHFQLMVKQPLEWNAFPTYGKAAVRIECSPTGWAQIRLHHYKPNTAQENWQLHANGK